MTRTGKSLLMAAAGNAGGGPVVLTGVTNLAQQTFNANPWTSAAVNVAAGSLVLVTVKSNSDEDPVLSGTNGLSWTKIARLFNSDVSFSTSVFWAYSAGALSSKTVVATFAGSEAGQLIVDQLVFTGLNTSAPIKQFKTAELTNGAHPSATLDAAPTGPTWGSLARGARVASAGAGYTLSTDGNGLADTEYDAAGSVTVDMTLAGGNSWGAIIGLEFSA